MFSNKLKVIISVSVICVLVLSYIVYSEHESNSLTSSLIAISRYSASILDDTSQFGACGSHGLGAIDRELFELMSFYLRDKPYAGIVNYARFIATRLNLTPLANVKPIQTNFTPIYNDVASFRYTAEVSPCTRPSANQISLFVAIISAPGNSAKRKAIRDTWFSQLKSELNSVRNPGGLSVVLAGAAFVIGRQANETQDKVIYDEAIQYADILQVDMIDAYFNLSIKVAGLMSWIDRECHFVDFVLKVDDDVYVNVRNLGSFLRQLDPHEASVYGIQGNQMVPRSGKWSIQYEDYPWANYPPFFLGPTILMSHASLRPLLAAIQTIPYFPIDDVYLTGMCRERSGSTYIFADRMLAITGAKPIEDCWVRDYVSFLRGDATQILYVHNITEYLYANVTQCLRNNGTIAEDPFSFYQFTLRRL